MLPIEKNARRLVGVLLQYFPVGATSEDLRRKFETETSLARQSYYSALAYSKKQGWVVKGERDRLYKASPDGAWREERIVSIGENLEKDRLAYLVDSQNRKIGELQSENERLRDWSNSDADGVGVAIPSLMRMITDSASTMRQKIKAASFILNYEVEDSEVTTFVRGFLESVCTSDVATDHKLEAGELLRKHESPRVQSGTVRPDYPANTPEEPVIPLMELVRKGENAPIECIASARNARRLSG